MTTAEVLKCGTTDILGWRIFAGEGVQSCALEDFITLPDLYSVDVCSILPVMTTTTKTSPGEENHHSQKALQGRPGWEAISQEEIKAALDCRNGGKKMDLREM